MKVTAVHQDLKLRDNDIPIRTRTTLPEVKVEGPMEGSGSSRIYLGKLRVDDTPVVIKTFEEGQAILTNPYDWDDWQISADHELELLYRAHPVAPKVLAAARGTYPFIAMEYIPGKTLDEVINDSRFKSKLTPSDQNVLLMMHQIAAALNFIHIETETIHADVKPKNILISTEQNEALLLDFGSGCSKHYGLYNPGTRSARYASPERLDGGWATIRDDIYALGLTIFEYATRGQTLFKVYSNDREMLAERKAAQADFRELVSPDIERLISRMLGVNGYQRIDDYSELFVAIDAAVQ